MNSYLKKILIKKIKKNQTPFGMDMPSFMADFNMKLPSIENEWYSYIKKANFGSQFDEISADQVGLNDDKKWNVLIIYGYYHFNTNVRDEFPVLVGLIEKHKSEINLVMFSTTLAKKTIPAHHGNNIGVNRVQIGIDIKEPNECYLRVVDRKIHLREKEMFIFDDTFEHELVNNGNSVRTVLIIDTFKKLPWLYKLINVRLNKKISKSDYVQSVLSKINQTS